MRRWVLALALCACSAKKGGAPEIYQLRGEAKQLEAVDKDFAEVRTAWLGELSHGDRRAALIWPAVAHGEVVDDDLLYVVFARDGGGWKLLGEKEAEIDARDDQVEQRLQQALGGEYELVRPDGYPIDELGPKLLDATKRFHAALAAKDDAAAIAALEDFMRGFDRDMMHGGNAAADFLLDIFPKVEKMTVRGDDRSATLVATVEGKEVTVPVTLRKSGAGWAIASISSP